MLRHRILSAAIGLPTAILVIYFGGMVFAVSICAIAMLASYEIYVAMRRAGIEVVKEVVFPCVAICIFVTYEFANDASSLFTMWSAIIFVSLFGSMAFYIFVHTPSEGIGNRSASIGVTVFATAYACMFAFLILLRQLDKGRALMLITLLTVWGADATAYFVGKVLGGKKVCEHVSPGKTLSGCIAHLLSALILAPLLSLILRCIPAFAVETPTPIEALPIGLIAGTFGQLGDLCKSVIKRDLGIKDFGAIIPGHGGILDRFDSLLISTPLIYFYATALL